MNTAPAVMVGSRSWSTLWAKKHTLRRQPAPSLHSCRQQGGGQQGGGGTFRGLQRKLLQGTCADDCVCSAHYFSEIQLESATRSGAPTVAASSCAQRERPLVSKACQQVAPPTAQHPAPPACGSGWGAASTRTRRAHRCRRRRACRCPAQTKGEEQPARPFKFPAGRAAAALARAHSAKLTHARYSLHGSCSGQQAKHCSQLTSTAGSGPGRRSLCGGNGTGRGPTDLAEIGAGHAMVLEAAGVAAARLLACRRGGEAGGVRGSYWAALCPVARRHRTNCRAAAAQAYRGAGRGRASSRGTLPGAGSSRF